MTLGPAFAIRRASAAILLVLVPGLALAVSLSSARHARKFLKPPRVTVSAQDRDAAAAKLPGLGDVVLRTQDGLALAGWFAPGHRRSAVVFVHGLGGNRMELLPEAAMASRRGHGVLVYDSRASGNSEGERATWGDRERLDVRAALDFLTARPEVDAGRIAVYGFSVGASAAALVAADDPRVRAVVLGPTWPSLRSELEAKFHRWGALSAWSAERVFRFARVDLDAVRPIDVIAKIAPRPLLFISGAEDRDTPPDVMDRVAAAAPFAQRWTVPGAGHGECAKAAPVEFESRFGRFLDASLGPLAR